MSSLLHSFTPLLLSACALLMGCKHTTSPAIRLNQVGFAPNQEKTATIDMSSFSLQTPFCVSIFDDAGETVWQGKASETMLNPVSGKPCQIVDFSSLTTPGTYTLCLENKSPRSELSIFHCPRGAIVRRKEFSICSHPYRELTRKALRAFYYQRASMPIEEPYAEGFSRPAGHPDDHVLVHASAATNERPENTVISCPGGWYDAGDYNKYIVNSGFTMGVFLMAYEMNPNYYDTLCLNIPEYDLPVPDMLAEAMYNIRWMMTMQDLDGGVYHKLTEPDFEGFIRPDECKKPRYVVLKTTAAALDFAATMALAARVYAPFEIAYPGFVAQATEAALRAYAWAQANPEIYYDQPKMNEQFSPAITTGAYDDFDVTDEFYWAATELYLLTKDEKYKEAMLAHQPKEFVPASWGKVAELASLEQLTHPDSRLSTLDSRLLTAHLAPYLDEAETISVHRSPYGNREDDFFWGCNSEGCCWRGIECLYAYRFTGDKRYLKNAERCLNFILGQNATGYCYVTGFGTKPTSDPHHRLSFSHPKGTHPGFLAGGPNPARQDAVTDGVKYPKDVPADESYLDYQPSYASNEVTINWNVTLFALSGGLDALE